MQTVKLNNCVQMPIIGYGVFMIDPSITERCVLDALSVGYRSLDTAQYYENEAAVGAAVRKSGIPRDQIFITSKLCQSRPSYVQAKENVKGTLRRVIPKSTHRNRMEENLNVLDFELTESDMTTLRTLDLGHPMDGWPSDALTY